RLSALRPFPTRRSSDLGPQAAWFAEQFPIEVRYSGVNMGYQLGTVIGGGIMPMIAALLFVAGGSTPWLICAYLTVLPPATNSRADRKSTRLNSSHVSIS